MRARVFKKFLSQRLSVSASSVHARAFASKRNVSWPMTHVALISVNESLTILQNLVEEMKGYGIPSVVLLVGMIWTARMIGKLESNVGNYRDEIQRRAASDKEVAEAKFAANEAKIAANEKVVEAKVAANKEAAEAKFAANEAKIAANEKAAEAKVAANKEAAEAKFAANEAKVAANKEAAEAKFAANESKIAANEMAANAKIAANEAKLSANKDVLTEISKNAAMVAELAALKVELGMIKK
jgi:hypothetical protein